MQTPKIPNFNRLPTVSADPNRRLTFREWIVKNGGTSDEKDASYYSDLAAAERRYAEDVPTYGSTAEALGKQGLTDSGYENYLRFAVDRKKADAEADALGRYYGRKRKSYAGYEKYVTDYTEKQQSLFTKVFRTLSQNGILDPNRAYAYAIGAGLNESSAQKAAASGIAAAKAKLLSDASSYVARQNLGEKEAKAYALSLGLSERDAKRIADYAKEERYGKVQEAELLSSMTGSEYVEYLRALKRKQLLQ